MTFVRFSLLVGLLALVGCSGDTGGANAEPVKEVTTPEDRAATSEAMQQYEQSQNQNQNQ